jgi:hypothetical protein
MRPQRYLISVALFWGMLCMLDSSKAVALPVFARVYDKPCGTCHTVFPQLNPAGEDFRAHGFHGVPPSIKPLRVGSLFDVPGTLPLVFYVTAGEDVTKVDVPGQSDPTRTHFNLDYFTLAAGGELGQHLAFLLDWELVETEPDSGEITINDLPRQAYLTAHAEPSGWLVNLKGGWYELPLTVSPDIHRLSVQPYLIYSVNACTLLGVDPPHGTCDDEPVLGETQIGGDLSAWYPERGFAWSAGITNGSNNRLATVGSPNGYVHLVQAMGTHRIGFLMFYSPDLAGNDVQDRTLRLGPDMDLYSRRWRLLGQFLAGYESNPAGTLTSLWYYGGFLEAQYRLTTTLLSLVRFDYAWTPRFDDTTNGGDTRVERRIWEITGGGQWSILQNLKLVAEVTYGENHESVSDTAEKTWIGALHVVTAFWPLTPPGLSEWQRSERAR